MHYVLDNKGGGHKGSMSPKCNSLDLSKFLNLRCVHENLHELSMTQLSQLEKENAATSICVPV